VHYLMTVRSDYAWAGSYAMVVILILALRFAMWRQTRGSAPLSAATRKPATTD
jgi:DMSO/TMAO reductase YedYZ heme-binding membrane subunit